MIEFKITQYILTQLMIGMISAESAFELLQQELGNDKFAVNEKNDAIRFLYSLGVIPRTLQFIYLEMKSPKAVNLKSCQYLQTFIIESIRTKYPPEYFTAAIRSQQHHRILLHMMINRATMSWPSASGGSDDDNLEFQLSQRGFFWVRRIVNYRPEILVPFFLRWSWLNAMSYLTMSRAPTESILRVLQYQKAICEPAALDTGNKGLHFEEVVATMIASRMLLCFDESKLILFIFIYLFV